MPSTATITYRNPEGSVPAQGLYSNVGTPVDGKLHFVAGQLAVGPDGEVVGVDDFDAQFDCVFGNLDAVLKGMGGSLASVVKFNTFVTDRRFIKPFMAKRAALFPTVWPDGVFPPNTLLIVAGLVKPEFVLEVEAVIALAE